MHQCPGKKKIKEQRGGRTTIHFTACDENVRLLLKMVMSVNQLSLYGAVADSRISGRSRSSRETCCIRTDGTRNSYSIYIVEVPSNDERQGNLMQNYEQRFERLPEDQKLSKLCSEAGLNLVEVGQFFCALPSPKEPKAQSLC